MRRDMDLIRLLLLETEKEEKPDLSSYTEEQIHYHTYLLIDGELVFGSFSQPRYVKGKFHIDRFNISLLTSKGRDFLDDARDETVWREAKKVLATKGITVSLAVLQVLLQNLNLKEY